MEVHVRRLNDGVESERGMRLREVCLLDEGLSPHRSGGGGGGGGDGGDGGDR